MKKSRIIPLVLVLVGLAFFLGALFFILDKGTSSNPPGLGEQIIEVLILLLGAGTGIKGWLDLRGGTLHDTGHGQKEQRTQELVDSQDSEQTMEGKGGVQRQKAVRSPGSKQNMK